MLPIYQEYCIMFSSFILVSTFPSFSLIHIFIMHFSFERRREQKMWIVYCVNSIHIQAENLLHEVAFNWFIVLSIKFISNVNNRIMLSLISFCWCDDDDDAAAAIAIVLLDLLQQPCYWVQFWWFQRKSERKRMHWPTKQTFLLISSLFSFGIVVYAYFHLHLSIYP